MKFIKSTKSMKSIKYKSIPILLIGVFVCSFLTSCNRPNLSHDPYTKQIIAFDTISSIAIYDDMDKESAGEILNQCNLICNTYDNMFSRTKSGSDIYNINHSNGKPTKVSAETIYLIKESLTYCDATDGIVDISIAPLKEIWDFSNANENADQNQIPSQVEINEVLKYIDFKNIIIDENNLTITLANANCGIDLGFIAKGYIADQLASYLRSQNIEHALINLGGNVYAIGQKPDHTDFTVGIQKPFDTNAYIDTISVHDQSVVTSGVYERYFKVDDKLYHHVLDPHTGYPVDSDLYSVTIICDSSMKADALSTSCLLLGSEKAKVFLKNYPDVSAYFIYDDYKTERINDQ